MNTDEGPMESLAARPRFRESEWQLTAEGRPSEPATAGACADPFILDGTPDIVQTGLVNRSFPVANCLVNQHSRSVVTTPLLATNRTSALPCQKSSSKPTYCPRARRGPLSDFTCGLKVLEWSWLRVSESADRPDWIPSFAPYHPERQQEYVAANLAQNRVSSTVCHK